MKQGFTLLELAIVLIIIGLIVSLSMMVGTQQVRQQETNATLGEMAFINNALSEFVVKYNRLPCPMPSTLPATDADYGFEATDCADSSSPAGLARAEFPASSGTYIRIGALPFRSLNLSDDFLTDGWNKRYIYAVTENFLDGILDAENGVMQVNDEAGNAITTQAVYALVSTGLSKKGSVDTRTLTIPAACDATDRDGENCNDDGFFVDAPVNDGDIVGNFFDDIIVWRNKPRLMNLPATRNIQL